MKRYKIILILSGIIILIGLVWYLQYQKIKAIKEKTTLQVENKYLYQQIKQLKSESEDINELRTEIDEANKKIAENAEKDRLRQELINKRNIQKEKEAEKVSNDSSFKYIQEIYKPIDGEKFNYCITGSQIKRMHVNDIKFQSLVSKHKGLIMQYAACKKILKNSTRQHRLANKQIKNLKEEGKIKDQIISNKDAEIKVMSKDLGRKKAGNLVWKIGAGTAVTLLFINLAN